MKADAMEEFDDSDDLESAFIAEMHRGGIDYGISFIDLSTQRGICSRSW